MPECFTQNFVEYPQAVRPLTVHATPNWILARRLAMHFDFQRSMYSLANRCLSRKATDMIYISVEALHSTEFTLAITVPDNYPGLTCRDQYDIKLLPGCGRLRLLVKIIYVIFLTSYQPLLEEWTRS
ncbi:hypothetical protein VNO77_01246 [Canavalia gladiata]|uniref:Uncharacterized protein n=1 Tax=Canavalia gladiata TaxID=3824 RepID=A0AAN9MVP7_CANGL